MRRLFWFSLVLLALVASACGGGSDGDVVVGEEETRLPEPDVSDGDADDAGIVDGSVDAAAQLAAALAAAGSDTSYGIDLAQGTTLRVAGVGLNQVIPLDETRFSTSSVIDGDSSYVEMNLTAMLGPLGTPDDVTLQMWTTPELMVIDTTSYQQIMELNPAGDLGPFSPGVGSVDLTALAGESDAIVNAIAGTGPLSLEAFTAGLIDALSDVTVTDDGRTYTGTASHGALIEAQGNEVETVARSLAGGLALNLGVDVDALTDLYVDVYNAAPSSVVVVLDDAGLLSEVRVATDLSILYEELPTMLGDLLGSGVDADDLGALFADPVFDINQVLFFDLDPADAPAVPTETEDRTDAWVAFLEASGF